MEKDVTFLGAFTEMWTRAFDYKGVSNRKQYWFPFALHAVLALLASGLILCSLLVGKGGLFFALAAAVIIGYLILSIIPWASLTVRRLRDSGRSGWWALLVLVLGVGMIILMILCTSASVIYNSIGNGGFDPAQNEIECVYGPPEMFDPSYNEPEEIYGPPEMFEPSENELEEVYGPPMED